MNYGSIHLPPHERISRRFNLPRISVEYPSCNQDCILSGFPRFLFQKIHTVSTSSERLDVFRCWTLHWDQSVSFQFNSVRVGVRGRPPSDAAVSGTPQAQLTWGCQRLNPIFLFTFRYFPSSIQGCSHRLEVINRYGCGGAWEHLHLRLAGELLKDAEGRRRFLGSVSPIFHFFVLRSCSLTLE